MNARVSLLVLVAFTFMAIWDADRQGKATKPVHSPQPINWHLPLPVPGDEMATMATPITPSQAEVEIAAHELTATTVDSPYATEVPHTNTESANVVEATTTESVADAETKTETTAVPTEPLAGSDDESTVEETGEQVGAQATDSDVTAIPVSVAVEELSVPAATNIPENLKVADPVMSERVMNLSRSALAVHEHSLVPINPELTIEVAEGQPVQSMPAVDTKAAEAVVVDEVKIDDQSVSEKTEEPTVDCLPVPRNLASGTWQLISQDGEMMEITITRPEQPAGDQSMKDRYAVGVNSEGKRWAFIRVERSAVADSSKSEPEKQDRTAEPARPAQKAATEFFSPTTR